MSSDPKDTEQKATVADVPEEDPSEDPKKKSKTKKIKDALTPGSSSSAGESSTSSAGKKPQLSEEQFKQLLELNPSLKAEVQGMKPEQVREMMAKMSLTDIITGMSTGGGSKKDMAGYKFWQTQPVPRFEEMKKKVEEGPIKEVTPEMVPKEPSQMYPGFEWVTMDLTDDKELAELYELLSHHYVEDLDATFRFNYSKSFLDWALKSPGWLKEWHVGVRATQSKKLVAFISAIPIDLRIRERTVKASEVNFLCVHKKLRDKRLTPVLIKEITRRCNVGGVYQAIYTAGILLPTPVSTCRYFHRSLDWEKLLDVGFSHLPPGSTKQRQVIRYKLPAETSTPGLRVMAKADIPAVQNLLTRYLDRFKLATAWSESEIEHWMIHNEATTEEQVIWSYVVEDKNKKITDFFSFYRLESTALLKKNEIIRAAYLYYYATETAFGKDKAKYKTRLNELMHDALILAKKANFDVFNALTLLDNPLFLEDQKFGAGDGQLNYYLFNYRTATIPGGIDTKNKMDEKAMGGVGVVML